MTLFALDPLGLTSQAPKANKGVKRRFAADLAAQPTAEELAQSHNRKSALERKAELYERLKRGDTAGLTPGQRASLGVDFDRKVQQEWDRRDEEQEEESEEKSVSSGGSDDEESVSAVCPFDPNFDQVRLTHATTCPHTESHSSSS